MLESLEAKDALVQQLDSVSHLKVGCDVTCILTAASQWAGARTPWSFSISSQGAATAMRVAQGDAKPHRVLAALHSFTQPVPPYRSAPHALSFLPSLVTCVRPYAAGVGVALRAVRAAV